VTNTDDVRAANDIVSVIGGYVPLKKAGVQKVGLCPFHKEKTPSFYVHPIKQVFKCHGCGTGGDVFKFIQEIEHIDFVKAKDMLAARAGITMSTATATELKAWAAQRDEHKLIEHFRLVEGVSLERARAEFHKGIANDPEYRAWLKADLAHAHALTGVLVGVIAVAQERDADYPEGLTV
jgi:DNA primase catalytic core